MQDDEVFGPRLLRKAKFEGVLVRDFFEERKAIFCRKLLFCAMFIVCNLNFPIYGLNFGWKFFSTILVVLLILISLSFLAGITLLQLSQDLHDLIKATPIQLDSARFLKSFLIF